MPKVLAIPSVSNFAEVNVPQIILEITLINPAG